MAGIGGAELRMPEHCGIELDYVHVMSRDLLRHADQSSSGRPRSRYFDGGWNSTSRRRRMTKGRLEGFSDGVIAILITIMVLELKVPHGPDWDALRPLVPVFLTYVLSFVIVGIYWNNHHHMLHAAERINGKVMIVPVDADDRSEEHTSELQSRSDLVCRLLLEKKNKEQSTHD